MHRCEGVTGRAIKQKSVDMRENAVQFKMQLIILFKQQMTSENMA